MKKIALLATCLLCFNLAKSQILISLLLGDKLNSEKLEFGVDGGLAVTNMKGLEHQNLRTFNLGFYFDIRLKEPHWIFNTGLLMKSNMGASQIPIYTLMNPVLDTLFKDGFVERKVSMFSLPLILKYKFDNNIFVEGGFQLGLRTKGYDYFYTTVTEKEDAQYKNNISKTLPRLDAGLSVGLGYRLLKGNGMNLSARYYSGLVQNNFIGNKGSYTNQAFYLNVGIPIGKKPVATK
jgi:hypothetical protein